MMPTVLDLPGQGIGLAYRRRSPGLDRDPRQPGRQTKKTTGRMAAVVTMSRLRRNSASS